MLLSALLTLLPVATLLSHQAAQVEPEWIWGAPEPGADQSCWFFQVFESLGEIESAELWTSCDNELELFVNGQRAAESEDWSLAVRRDIAELLVGGGRNRIAARGHNTSGPAGFWFELEIEYAGGGGLRVTSDATWLATLAAPDDWTRADFEPLGWGQATSFGVLGCAPWGSPTGTIDGLPPRALAAAELELAAGFEAELVYTVPRSRQGSWVSLAQGPRGTLFASDQYGAIYEIQPSAVGAGEHGTQVRALDLEVGQAQGLLWAFDSLYFVGGTGGAGSGLYRALDSDGDGELDELRLLRALEGGGEHGPHAVRLAPDGAALYVIAGNHTALPELAGSRVPLHWGEDQLLPRTPDPRGHAVGVLAPGGWLCRVSPDGAQWELVACGMRNAYDFDFDAAGEILTFDSDMEWDVGLAWYRPARLLHLVSGADFGWRHGSGKWPASYPDSWPGLLDVGLASPTGVEFAPSNFPGEWSEALFVADWAYGTLYAVHLSPHGATLAGELELFARGKPFPVTDLVAGEDGSLYVTTGGRRTQSGLYRIRSVAQELARAESPPPPSSDDLSRFQRRRLESLQRPLDRKAIKGLWPSLGSSEPFVRRAARVALEHQEVTLWQDRALAEEAPRSALTALLALARCGEVGLRERLCEAYLRLPLERLEPPLAIEALRLYALIAIRQGPLESAQRARVAARLDPLFPSGDEELDRELCRVLTELEAPRVVERSLDLHDQADGQEARVHYLFTLKTLRTGWTPATRQRYLEALDRAIATFEGGASLRAYLEGAREAHLEGLDAGTRRALEAVAGARRPETVAAVPAAFVRAWKMADFSAQLEQDWSERDLDRGRELLERATCLVCHRFGGEGGNTGPDLAGAGSRFSARDLLENILQPSVTISDQYEETELWTVDEELLVGRVEEEDDELVWLRTLPPAEELVGIEKHEIQLRRPHPLSRMPEGLVDTLQAQELLDLLACLIVGPR
jgi:putative heme-binding domain-containing protein